jgi:hypothetical protein
MGISTKKEHERYYLDLFRSTCRLFPEGSIEEGESPDFIVSSPDWSKSTIVAGQRQLFLPQGS